MLHRISRASTPAPRSGIAPALFYGMFALLLSGNALLGTALLFSPDIAKLLNGQGEQIVDAYENRIAQLRVEVDRLHSRSYAQAGDINLQLQELTQQQEVLLEQHQLVKVLVDKADALGIATASAPAAAMPPVALATFGGSDPIETTAASLAAMLDETQSAMSAIATTATSRADAITTELADLGIAVPVPETDLSGVGGPFIAATDGAEPAPMIEDANAVLAALTRFKAARDGMDSAPVHMPIAGNFRQSSGFGTRTDPFSGGRAFHAGLDFAAPSGSTVLAAGVGTVTFVGEKSGYGNLVEITHDDGLVTRYGHLSAFLATKGQRVNTGTPIARVGSTGRSTGPHLHFEVRKGDVPTDPKVFLDAGKRLVALL